MDKNEYWKSCYRYRVKISSRGILKYFRFFSSLLRHNLIILVKACSTGWPVSIIMVQNISWPGRTLFSYALQTIIYFERTIRYKSVNIDKNEIKYCISTLYREQARLVLLVQYRPHDHTCVLQGCRLQMHGDSILGR